MPRSPACDHVFHTKHDFSPELGWAAWNLLPQNDDEGAATIEELENLARMVSSPLASRAGAHKVFGGLCDVGLAQRSGNHLALSPLGRAAAQSEARYEGGFRRTVHALYFWKSFGPEWSDEAPATATPSWSYRTLCRHLYEAGAQGIGRDELVLRVLEDAAPFGAEKISFSRSSVTGTTAWLDAQGFPLLVRQGASLFAARAVGALETSPEAADLALHCAALCGLCRGEAVLDARALDALSHAMLCGPSEVLLALAQFCEESDEFLLLQSYPARLVFRQTEHPLIAALCDRQLIAVSA